ncbi:MAG: polysaccharide deacetylase family protein [Oxalobacteraceae bacterium]
MSPLTPRITPPRPVRWRMPLLIRITVALHAAMLLAVVIQPRAWAWVLAVIIANHLVLALTGLLPRSTWLGANWTRLPPAAAARGEIALTIDDGPDPEVTPQVLDLLDRYDVKATFFCIGDNAARYPELCKNIAERGHAVENHSQRHPHYFSLLGSAGITREIQAGQETLTRITGQRPMFFRAPAGLRNPLLDPVLARLELRLAAWSRRGYDTRSADAAAVCRRLLHDMKAGSILLLHDGNCARTPAGIPVLLEVLPTLINTVHDAGLRFVTLRCAAEGAESAESDFGRSLR